MAMPRNNPCGLAYGFVRAAPVVTVLGALDG